MLWKVAEHRTPYWGETMTEERAPRIGEGVIDRVDDDATAEGNHRTTMKEHPYVEETPGVNGGYPVVRGTRTAVRIIVNLLRMTGGDVDRTSAMLPHLTREQILGALAYYVAYPGRVDEDIERNRRALVELQSR